MLPLCLAQGIARATENAAIPDKSAFNLFNAVPANLMRELQPDRPDETETPHTVDAGHFQLEMDFANFTYNSTSHEITRAWSIAPVNLKVGLLNSVDLQFVYDDYLRFPARIGEATKSGFGDLTTRMKINLWGNDAGETAFALLPYIKFPTSTGGVGNNAVEGGMIFPFAMKLPEDFELGAETAAGVFRNANDSGHHEEFMDSITVDHTLIGKLSGYLEFFSNVSTERHSDWVGTADVGLEFLMTKNAQLDFGCNIGLTGTADTAHAFAGVTLRF